MDVINLIDNKQSCLPQGQADFLLACSVTKTCEITGITQAGIPGKIPLTPTLDAEFLVTGKVFSLEDLAETETGIPTPSLLTRAVHLLTPFRQLQILDLGLQVAPKQIKVQDFSLNPSPSICHKKGFDAQTVFNKGRQFAVGYQLQGDYLIIGESTPAGTTTAQAAIQALGFESKSLFASSFKNAPLQIKEETINKALAKLTPTMSLYEKLGHTADQSIVFIAGFLLQASNRFDLVLAGGTQMAAALLIADKLAEMENINFTASSVSLCTTRWIAQDGSSDINALLAQLSFKINALYANFLYEDANIPVLKLYDQGEAKEGGGAGAAIAYALTQGVTQAQLTAQVESLMIGS